MKMATVYYTAQRRVDPAKCPGKLSLFCSSDVSGTPPSRSVLGPAQQSSVLQRRPAAWGALRCHAALRAALRPARFPPLVAARARRPPTPRQHRAGHESLGPPARTSPNGRRTYTLPARLKWPSRQPAGQRRGLSTAGVSAPKDSSGVRAGCQCRGGSQLGVMGGRSDTADNRTTGHPANGQAPTCGGDRAADDGRAE